MPLATKLTVRSRISGETVRRKTRRTATSREQPPIEDTSPRSLPEGASNRQPFNRWRLACQEPEPRFATAPLAREGFSTIPCRLEAASPRKFDGPPIKVGFNLLPANLTHKRQLLTHRLGMLGPRRSSALRMGKVLNRPRDVIELHGEPPTRPWAPPARGPPKKSWKPCLLASSMLGKS